MPKMKTHKGTAKRVKLTKTGKLLRGNAATHHKLSSQTSRSKRAKTTESQITGKMRKDVKRALGA